MSAPTLFALPPEMREKIFGYCGAGDLLNLGCCSKQYYGSIKHIIWRTVKVRWSSLDDRPSVKRKELSMKNITTLHLNTSVRGKRAEYVKTALDEDKISTGTFKYFLKNCCSVALTALYLNGYLVRGGLRITAEFLPQVKHLELRNIHIRYVDWDYLARFEKLEFLLLNDCSIRDGHVEKLTVLQYLVEFRVIQCLQLTTIGMQHICNMRKLRKLAFTNHKNVPSDSIKLINTNLDTLEELDLSYTYINVGFFENLGRSLSNIRVLKFAWCIYLDDIGLDHISHLKMLKSLDISFSFFISDEGLHYLSRVGSLTRLILHGCIEVSDTGLLGLKGLQNLQEINLKHCTQVTAAGIDEFRNHFKSRSVSIIS